MHGNASYEQTVATCRSRGQCAPAAVSVLPVRRTSSSHLNDNISNFTAPRPRFCISRPASSVARGRLQLASAAETAAHAVTMDTRCATLAFDVYTPDDEIAPTFAGSRSH